MRSYWIGYAALGYGGQALGAIPALRLVIVQLAGAVRIICDRDALRWHGLGLDLPI
jgi:hypothetical protein